MPFNKNVKRLKAERNIRTIGSTIIQRPQRINPYATGKGYVWIEMTPRKILSQSSKIQGGIRASLPEPTYKFLAPLSLNETISHTWTEYESLASRLAQKVRGAAKVGAEIQGLTKVFGSGSTEALSSGTGSSGTFSAQGIENLAKKAYNAIPGSAIPKVKIDTPLYYENSTRRQITLDFVLFAENNNPTEPEQDIMVPITDLMRYSAAEFTDGITIDFPYMFDIRTSPIPFIQYTTCALQAVQPTYNQPYYNGYPSSCNLQLTFMDLSPLYRETIVSGSVIKVVVGAATTAADALGVKPTSKQNLRFSNTPRDTIL